MPTYCYTTPDETETIEEVFSVGKAPAKVRRNGKVYERDIAAEHQGSQDHGGQWPILCDASGVHPDQVPEAMAVAKRKGVPTTFTRDGRAILRDRAHRVAYHRAVGLFDRDGGYGDAQQG